MKTGNLVDRDRLLLLFPSVPAVRVRSPANTRKTHRAVGFTLFFNLDQFRFVSFRSAIKSFYSRRLLLRSSDGGVLGGSPGVVGLAERGEDTGELLRGRIMNGGERIVRCSPVFFLQVGGRCSVLAERRKDWEAALFFQASWWSVSVSVLGEKGRTRKNCRWGWMSMWLRKQRTKERRCGGRRWFAVAVEGGEGAVDWSLFCEDEEKVMAVESGKGIVEGLSLLRSLWRRKATARGEEWPGMGQHVLREEEGKKIRGGGKKVCNRGSKMVVLV